ncbi:uncharacterized protein LOC119350643 [Triticum dicoccoides]|uniref:uncharacterized protein LOC119350643 n=1 Tax=Triticum dicoccoides TaxID=85692 RepID=UPI00188EAE2C|nr:uncharacterized protein LOC119350643 [Triticum dicoccoides]
MIQEQADYKSLDLADILERLNTHEFQLAKKRDLYGSSYGKPRALKAKVVSKSECEDSGSSLGDPEELSQELALLVKKFQKFSRRGRFGKSSRSSDSSSSDYKRRLCHKCKKPGHYIQDCPQWEKELKKKKYKDYSSDDAKKKKKSSKSSKSSSHKKISSKKSQAFIGKEMDSEAESEENEEEEASEESESGVASLAFATAFVSKSIFNTKETDPTDKPDEDNDDYTPTYCFMAKGAKVLKYTSSESSENESDENLKPSYSKLAKIAAIAHVDEHAIAHVDEDAIDQDDVYESDDEGPPEELDEDGFTAQENQVYKKVNGKERGPSFFHDLSLADKAVVDGGMRLCLVEPSTYPRMGDLRPPSEDENAHLKKGIKFGCLQEFKIWLSDYAIRNHRPYVVGHSNQMCTTPSNVTKKVALEGPWKKVNEIGQGELKSCAATHECILSDKADRSKGHRQLMSAYLGYKLLNEISHNPTVKVKLLMSLVFERFGYGVKYGNVWMAKANAIRMLHGDYAACTIFFQECWEPLLIRT